MNNRLILPTPVLALLLALMALPGDARAAPYLGGTVGYDYYISGVDDDGFEWVDADIYAQRVVNDSAGRSGPLSLAGWLTQDSNPAGAGVEAGYLPIGTLAPNSQVEVYDTVAADDVRPGEYFVSMLLQDDRYPGTWEDDRALPPTLLWRGGLEAVGPLRLYQYSSGRVDVDFNRLENRRLDGRYTNAIALRLLATYGFGPASDGFVLCEKVEPGMYSGVSRFSPGFSCYPTAAINGEFTLHLEVAEVGGRGGYSTLTGPDAYFRDGWIERFYGCGACFADYPYAHDTIYYAGSLGAWGLVPLLLAGLRRTRRALWMVVAIVLLPVSAVAAPSGDFSDAELDQMLAPIALYPDSVLSSVLIAATYPLEVAQAARWVREHEALDAEASLEAVKGRNWDDSVKALVVYPEILKRMDDDLDWTQDLGEAFLAQDDDVMDRVQALRRRADAAGSLSDVEQIQVVREREVIYIEPAVSRRVYIPYYDPWVVYGSWWWPAYPPHCWTYWGGRPVAYYHRYGAPFYWSTWVAITPGFYFSAFNWHRHHVVVIPRHASGHRHYRARDIVRYEGARRWEHDSSHRRQVEYRHQRLSHRSDDYRSQRRETVERGSYRERSATPSPSRATARSRAQRRESGEVRDSRARRSGSTAESGSVNRRLSTPRTPPSHDAKVRRSSERNERPSSRNRQDAVQSSSRRELRDRPVRQEATPAQQPRQSRERAHRNAERSAGRNSERRESRR